MKWKYFLKKISKKQEEIQILNSLKSVLKIKSVLKNFPTRKISNPDGLPHWWIFPSISIYNTKHIQTLSENREIRNTSKSFCEVNRIRILKPGSLFQEKKYRQSVSHEYRWKILHKILPYWIQQKVNIRIQYHE